ncbi:MAG: CDP-diacylglycerol--glycerol-3-phosphate 3-phosphatidyltransferase [Planctomycetota bacterium]|nr:CDP-diacylglycerol--glycerol-3-phosphate 3-phosphatidyltransferase [Planctomycetota bacterium]
MNLPNKITMGRFGIALIMFAVLIWTDTCSGPEAWAPALAGGIFILAVATDALDGYYARKLGQLSDFGRIADPVVDKVIVCGAFIFLASAQWAREFIPVWMVVLIVAREFLVNGLRGYIEARGVAFPARWDGKLKMIMQCIAIPAVFLVRTVDLALGASVPWLWQLSLGLAYVFVWASFVLTIVSGARYVVAAAQVLRTAED